MRFTEIRWVLHGLVCLALSHVSVHAEPYFTNKDGNQIWDKATGLVWMRCSLGQEWDGEICVGNADRFKFSAAQEVSQQINVRGYAGHKDWQVPTARQLSSLIFCPLRATKTVVNLDDGGAPVSHKCGDIFIRPAIHPSAFPIEKIGSYTYWTSSTAAGNNAAWHVNFSDGYVKSGHSRYEHNLLRLFRVGPLSDSQELALFTRPIPSAELVWAERKRMALEDQKKTAILRAEIERKEDEVQREAEAQAKAEKGAATKSLIDSGPKNIYQEADKAQLNGGVSYGGQLFYAPDLYQLIIEEFPQSDYAVKARGQINLLKRLAGPSALLQEEVPRDARVASCGASIKTCQTACTNRSDRLSCRQKCENMCRP